MIYAVIGLGSIGKRHLNVAKRIQDRVGITVIRGVDTNPGRREEVASSIDGVEVFADLAEAVEGAEIVVVCTPTASHIDLCSAICEHADPHIFIEKPLSHTLEGCDELIFNRARAGKQVAVGYFLRYHPMINKLKAIVDNGELGRVLMARAESGTFFPNGTRGKITVTSTCPGKQAAAVYCSIQVMKSTTCSISWEKFQTSAVFMALSPTWNHVGRHVFDQLPFQEWYLWSYSSGFAAV